LVSLNAGVAECAGAASDHRAGWGQHWRTERYGRDNPFLTAAACELLVDSDRRHGRHRSVNIDDIADLARPAHTILLGAGIRSAST
jgi:arylformamidase